MPGQETKTSIVCGMAGKSVLTKCHGCGAGTLLPFPLQGEAEVGRLLEQEISHWQPAYKRPCLKTKTARQGSMQGWPRWKLERFQQYAIISLESNCV